MISVGVLTPHAAPGPEVELPDMAPGEVDVRVSRIPAPGGTGSAPGTPPTTPSGLRAMTAPSSLDRAQATFPDGSVDVIGYASTSTGYAIGFDAESTMVERLATRWGLPVSSSSLSAAAALQALNVQRVALVHPPWFGEQLNTLGAAYFSSQGLEVVSSESAHLVNDPGRIEPPAIVEWVSGHVSDDAEAVFIGGNGFRAAGAIESLEERLGRPVLESNQVMFWSILAHFPADVVVLGYGRLFGVTPTATDSTQSGGDEFSR
jgi:maleate isomerase